MLIESPRWRPGDRDAWDKASKLDIAYGFTRKMAGRILSAEREIASWASARKGYVACSWGKDSVVVADLSRVTNWPLVWIRIEPIANPDCLRVRDEFLRINPHTAYDEICYTLPPGDDGDTGRSSPKFQGFAEAVKRYGDCYISGVRGAESASRAKLLKATAGVTVRSLAPLIKWSDQDVFSYLALMNLPIHPAYAMTFGGAVDRGRVRVGEIGGHSGAGTGRTEWEKAYYPLDIGGKA